LKPSQLKKLKMISLSVLASQTKDINYEDLMKSLDLHDFRELEDLIIDCIYNGLVKGKLD
jgi:hypothetical protein